MNLGNKNYYVNTDWLRRTFDIEPSNISDEELTKFMIDFIDSLRGDVIKPGLEKKFKKLGIKDNIRAYERLMNYLNLKNRDITLNRNYYFYLFFSDKCLEEKAKFFRKNVNKTSDINDLFYRTFNKDERKREDFIDEILKYDETLTFAMYKCVNKKIKKKLLKKYAKVFYECRFDELTNDDKKYLLRVLKNTGVIIYVDDNEYVLADELDYEGRINYDLFRKIISKKDISNEYISNFYTNLKGRKVSKVTEKQFVDLGFKDDYKRFLLLRRYFVNRSNCYYGFKYKMNKYFDIFENVLFKIKTDEDRFNYYKSVVDKFDGAGLARIAKLLYTDEELKSTDTLIKIIEVAPEHIRPFFSLFDDNNKNAIFQRFYNEIIAHCNGLLTDEEYEYVKRIAKMNNEGKDSSKEEMLSLISLIMQKRDSDLLKRLKARYGKSYVEKTNKSLDDEDEFFYRIISSNVLEDFYSNPFYTNDDIDTLNSILNEYDFNGVIDTKPIRHRIELIMIKLRKKENYLFNGIVSKKDKEDELETFLKSMNINKENFSKYIRERKFLDKKMKESLLLILASHYQTEYVSLYDVLVMIQESEETGKDLNIILKENNIDVKYFKTVFEKLKNENPELFSLIANVSNQNKKLIKLYSSLKESNIRSYKTFVLRYRKTPEEILALFEETELFDEVFKMLSSWYSFMPPEDNKDINITGPKKN